MQNKPSLYLVDGTAQIYRAFHAIRGLRTSSGLPTNAVYGFTSVLRRLLTTEQPDYLAVVFDPPGPTTRHAEYAEYKATRPPMDDDIVAQLPWIDRVCAVLRVRVLRIAGWEADDVMATLTRQGKDAGCRVVVVSGDKDMFQLVDAETRVLNPGREGAASVLYDPAGVTEKFGVPPSNVIDVLALVGDAVDNVPGVPGIGDKGARELVSRFGDLESVIAHAEEVTRKAYREGLLLHAETARLSRRLVTLRYDAPVSLDLTALVPQKPDAAAAHALFAELEFRGLAREFAPEPTVSSVDVRTIVDGAGLPDGASVARLAVVPVMEGVALCGLALAWAPGSAAYVSLPGATPHRSAALAPLIPLLTDAGVPKATTDSKALALALDAQGIVVVGVDLDATLAAYSLNPGRRSYPLSDLVRELLGEALADTPQGAPCDDVARHAGAAAEALLRLTPVLLDRLAAEGVAEAYRNVELPLAPLLARMERIGVRVDAELLRSMSKEMGERLQTLTAEIHRLAGGEFNISSPAQLREVLFDRLGLQSGKKTAKTREASTAEDVLEELALVHELPRKVLEFRSIQKLKSTYVDALPDLVRPETGRVHAQQNQTVAATGRLSASDPNLQNIPIRTAEGRRIREAFIAEPGWMLLSADYSQIELRILAHLSQDPTLIETFRRGEDIHDRTSLEVFGPFSPIPRDEQRRRSKMINYALLYGKTAFTLAKDLGVSRKDAEAFIQAYFARYPGVRGFLDETLARAREEGVVRTILGRLRRLPEIRARAFPVRTEAERQAINTPIQGSAADLIKKAMIDLSQGLFRLKLRSRLILQIHDELLLEVPDEEKETALALVKGVMEGALPLDVPLVVEARLGRTWADVH